MNHILTMNGNLGLAMALMSLMLLASCGEQGETSTQTNNSDSAEDSMALLDLPDSTGPPEIVLPPLVIEPPEINIGFVIPGEVAEGEVLIINNTDRPMKIISSKPSCQCTSVDLSGQIVPARGSLPLVAKFDGGYRLGSKTAVIRLIFEGYEEVIEVPVTAEIALAVRIEPNPIRHQIAKGENFQEQTEYVVESLDGKSFQVIAVQGESPSFVDYDPATEEPRNRYRLKWDFAKYNARTCLDEQGRPMPRYLAIETDHPDCRILDVRVRHACTRVEMPDIVGGQFWTLKERRVLLGTLKAGESREFTIEMNWLSQNQPDDHIVEVVSNSQQFTTELLGQELDNGVPVYRVRVTLASDQQGLVYGYAQVGSTRHTASLLIIGLLAD